MEIKQETETTPLTVTLEGKEALDYATKRKFLRITLQGDAAKEHILNVLNGKSSHELAKAQSETEIVRKLDDFLKTEQRAVVVPVVQAQVKPEPEQPRQAEYLNENKLPGKIYAMVRKRARVAQTFTTPKMVAGEFNIHKYKAARLMKYLTRKGFLWFQKRGKQHRYRPTSKSFTCKMRPRRRLYKPVFTKVE